MESRTTFLCPFCIKTQNIFNFDHHMVSHSKDLDRDGNPLILSKTLEELRIRFSVVGVEI